MIPLRTDAPPVTALLIPKFPLATFNERSRFDVFNLAAVIVASVIFVPEMPVAIFASVTAKFAIAPVSTALSASSVAVTASAAISASVIVSAAIFAAVIALFAIFAVVTFASSI